MDRPLCSPADLGALQVHESPDCVEPCPCSSASSSSSVADSSPPCSSASVDTAAPTTSYSPASPLSSPKKPKFCTKTKKIILLFCLLVSAGVGLGVLAAGEDENTLPFLPPWWSRLIFRVIVTGFGLGLWFVSQDLIAMRGFGDGGGIIDWGQKWTSPLNTWLLSHRRTTNAILIITSFFIDAFGLFMLGMCLFGPTMRPGIALLIMLLFRQIAQFACALPKPPSLIAHHPGFPSLLVTYGTANDFFFSGHTSTAVLGAIEVWKSAPLWVGIIAAFIACVEGFTVLVLQQHYSMDIICGVFASFCAEMAAVAICQNF